MGSSVPLDPRYGAAQITLRLADACRALGHDIQLWEPPKEIESDPWWTRLRRRRRAFSRHVQSQDDLDVVDALSWMISPELCEATSVCAVRSVQPDLEYLASSRDEWPIAPLRRAASCLHDHDVSTLIEKGWKSATTIVTLGEIEYQEMLRRHVEYSKKVRRYVLAPAHDERDMLRQIASRRPTGRRLAASARFLWIGRWSAHKGTSELTDFVQGFLEACPAARVTVAGVGAAAQRELGALSSTTDRFDIIETFERAELPPLLESHDAGLFTSRVEGWGLSLQEMLESGMPVFATRAGAAADLEPWFPSQLTKFPPDPESVLPEQESEHTYEQYATRFNWERIAADYVGDLEEFLP